jgi:hypothetical protein
MSIFGERRTVCCDYGSGGVQAEGAYGRYSRRRRLRMGNVRVRLVRKLAERIDGVVRCSSRVSRGDEARSSRYSARSLNKSRMTGMNTHGDGVQPEVSAVITCRTRVYCCYGWVGALCATSPYAERPHAPDRISAARGLGRTVTSTKTARCSGDMASGHPVASRR